MLALTRRFPGTAALSLAGIATLPTPLEPLAADLSLASLSVKRDDLTSRVYGGNKVRKLDMLLGDAIDEGFGTVLTFGAYGSNHALATAVFARRLGLEPHAVLSPQEPGPFAARTLLAHAALGTVIHLVEGWDGRREAVAAKRSLVERDGMGPYIIPMGGSCPLGVAAFVNAALELLEQAPAPDAVYVAGGTLGTAVGLALGFAAAGAPTRVEAVRVTPNSIASPAVAERLTREGVDLLKGADPTFPALAVEDLRLRLRQEFFEPGYGVVTEMTLGAVHEAQQLGIALETTYTGKAFSALLNDAHEGTLEGEHVVFWNTYNSAPYPTPGDEALLPKKLRDYVDECRRLFPEAI